MQDATSPPRADLTEVQAAADIGVSLRTLQRYRQNGSGPVFTRAGPRKIRYARVDLDAWRRERRSDAA